MVFALYSPFCDMQRERNNFSFSGMANHPIKYFVVDAFTGTVFKGNPAVVCILEEERDDEWMQSMASELNMMTCFLSPIIEADCNHPSAVNNGFLVPRFGLRWFSPAVEFSLCGHATIAASHIIFSSGLVKSNTVEYISLSGTLIAKKVSIDNKTDKFSIELNFPAAQVEVCNSVGETLISKAMNGAPVIEWKRTTPEDDLIVVLQSGKDVMDYEPNFNELKKIPGRGVLITGIAAPESEFDFISRYFFPNNGIPEDPVCGSAHCSLAPYWSKKLGKQDFLAYSASARGGIVELHYDEQKERVLLRGNALTVMQGTILV